MAEKENPSPHPLNAALGLRMQLRRQALGLTQRQLANQLRVTYQVVQQYEYGNTRISFYRLVRIAQALRWRVADLVGDLDKSAHAATPQKSAKGPYDCGVATLLEAYASITSAKHRHGVVDLARKFAKARTTPLGSSALPLKKKKGTS